MSAHWLHTWFPVVGLLLQVLIWGMLIPRLVSEKTMALLTFRESRTDPEF